MFLDELKKRNVPSLKSRAEMLELLQREEYGCLPKAPESFVWEAEPGVADNFCAGKATLEKLTFRVVVNGKGFVFPVYLAVPTAEGPHPFFRPHQFQKRCAGPLHADGGAHRQRLCGAFVRL